MKRVNVFEGKERQEGLRLAFGASQARYDVCI